MIKVVSTKMDGSMKLVVVLHTPRLIKKGDTR